MNRLPHKPHIYFTHGKWHIGEAYGTWLNRGKMYRWNLLAGVFVRILNAGDK